MVAAPPPHFWMHKSTLALQSLNPFLLRHRRLPRSPPACPQPGSERAICEWRLWTLLLLPLPQAPKEQAIVLEAYGSQIGIRLPTANPVLMPSRFFS
jgi:hypothetical protein